MKGGVLSRVLQEYFNVNLSELVNSFKSNYQGNSINDYYFNADYSTYTRNYLGANKLATSETRPTQLSDFAPSWREIVKNSIQEARKRIAQERENEDSAAPKAGQAEGGFMRVDRDAVYPGDNVSLSRFLQGNLRYPDTASNHNIQGTVLVQFAVNKDGSIGEVEVIHGNELGYGLPKEAVRVISIMPKWIPAQQGGNNIKSYKKLPIVFQLTAESVKP